MSCVSSLTSSLPIVRFSTRMRENCTILEAWGISQGEKCLKKNIIQLMKTARQRAQMETGMYRPFLPYFCMLELHNFYIILH